MSSLDAWRQGYCALNAAIYFCLGVGCTVWADLAAGASGYELRTVSARIEYITFYGGLEMGMFFFYLLASRRAELRPAAIELSVHVYSGLALFRWTSILFYQHLDALLATLGLIELGLAASAWILRVRQPVP